MYFDTEHIFLIEIWFSFIWWSKKINWPNNHHFLSVVDNCTNVVLPSHLLRIKMALVTQSTVPVNWNGDSLSLICVLANVKYWLNLNAHTKMGHVYWFKRSKAIFRSTNSVFMIKAKCILAGQRVIDYDSFAKANIVLS